MNSKNISIIISCYAAVIATISLIWNIVLTILEKLSRIKVEVVFYDNVITNGNDCILACIMNVNIVNKSKRKKFIKIPKMKLSFSHNVTLEGFDRKMVSLINLKDKRAYPIEIEPEAEVSFKYPFNGQSQWMLNSSKKNDTFRIIVTDTTGKSYKSKRMKVESLKRCTDLNDKVPVTVLEMLH